MTTQTLVDDIVSVAQTLKEYGAEFETLNLVISFDLTGKRTLRVEGAYIDQLDLDLAAKVGDEDDLEFLTSLSSADLWRYMCSLMHEVEVRLGQDFFLEDPFDGNR